MTSAPATAVNVFVTNALPFFCDHTDGLWRRLHLIQFSEVMVGRNTENTNLREELEQELPGIYNWALHGAAMLDPGKPFMSSDAGAQILQAHRIQCDPVPALIRKLFVGGCNKMVSRNRAYEKFK